MSDRGRARLVRTPVVRRAFAARYVGPQFYRRVEDMALLKCFDRNMEPDEIAALEKLAQWAAEAGRKQIRPRDDGSPGPVIPVPSASEPASVLWVAGRRGFPLPP